MVLNSVRDLCVIVLESARPGGSSKAGESGECEGDSPVTGEKSGFAANVVLFQHAGIFFATIPLTKNDHTHISRFSLTSVNDAAARCVHFSLARREEDNGAMQRMPGIRYENQCNLKQTGVCVPMRESTVPHHICTDTWNRR
jgi:hypothetical protein